MTTVTLSMFAGVGQQFFDNDGVPLAGGKLYSYQAGTTTPAATYTTYLGTITHSNPIVLDAAGRIPASGEIWLPLGIGYKFVVKTSADIVLATYDNVPTNAVAPILNDASSISYEPGYLVSAGSFVIGQTYQIAVVGTTDFTLIGATANTVGTLFIATGVGTGNGTAYLSTTVQAKLRQTVSVFDFMTAAQIADVQAGTLLIDCLAAFEAAMASFPTTFDNIYYSVGGTINVPPGKYYLSNTFKIDRNIKLIGAGAPLGNDTGASQLHFASNHDGILVVDYRNSPNNKQGTGVVIQDLYLTPKTSGGSTGSGVSLKTTARLVNLMCFLWPEHGIKIDASTSYSPASNANIWYLSGCTTTLNFGHGLYVNGADANAGSCYSHNAIANQGWGIYDSSFLGNTYVGCHTSDNVLGSYKSDDPNARNMFLNCYSEGGQPAAQVVSPSLIIGGLIDPGTSPAILGGVDHAIRISGYTGISEITIGYGQSNTSGYGLDFLDTQGTFSWSFGKAVGRWGYQWANLGVPFGFMFYDRTATPANGYARDISSASAPTASYGAIGVGEHYFGGSTQMKWRGLGTAAPTSGDYLQGDMVWNSSPTSGGYIGWVCTVSGNPGTWKTFGLIS